MEASVLTRTKTDSIKQILANQKKYFKTKATLPVDFRIKQLKKLKAGILKYETEILNAIEADLGKDHLGGYLTEVGFVLNDIEDALRNIRSWAKPKRKSTPLFHQKASSYVHSDPYGMTLIIAPWNYPFQLLFAPLVGAIAGGNTTVLKPSEVSIESTKVAVKMVKEIFDEEYVAIVDGGIPESQALLAEKFDYIFYTGSTHVGRIVYQAAAKHLTPVTLELGGKSPCIIDENTHIEYTAKRLLWGKLINAGQTCIAPDYIFVHQNIKDKMIAEFKKQIKAFFGDDPKGNSEYCKIINTRHFNRVKKLMNSGDIIYGGETDETASYIGPTIIDNVSPEDPIMQEEIFGPLIPIVPYNTMDEVVDFINDRPKPLALYVFSNNQKNINKILKETSSGGVCVNDTLMHIANPHLPFGGVGESGMGAYHGHASFTTFTHQKSVLHKSFLFDMPIRYNPYSAKTGNLLKTLLKRFNK